MRGLIFLLLLATPALAQTAEMSTSYYRGWNTESRTYSSTLTATDDLVSLSLGGSVQRTDGETAKSISMDSTVNLSPQSAVGVSAGATEHKSYWMGVKGSQWWQDDTLQTTVELQRSFTKQEPLDTLDVDGERIILSERVYGKLARLTVLHLTTPTLTLKVSQTLAFSDNRPPALATTAEVRKYIIPLAGALHVGVGHYENVGTLGAETLDGAYTANSGKLEWHQHLGSNVIWSNGYRVYLETEYPRAVNKDVTQLGTDQWYSTLRLGFDDWKHEAYVFGSRYDTNEPSKGILVGLGGKVQL